MNQQIFELDKLESFTHIKFGALRVMKDENGETLFCAKDVTAILDLKNSDGSIRANCDNPQKKDMIVTVKNRDGSVRYQHIEVYFIYLDDMFQLIMASRKKTAKPFQKWITKEVIPSIYHTGAYIDPRSVQSGNLSLEFLQTKYKEAQSAVNYMDIMTAPPSKGNMTLEMFAKHLADNGMEIGPVRFRRWLVCNKFIRTRPKHNFEIYQRTIESGLMAYNTNPIDGKMVTEMMITPKGTKVFTEMIMNEDVEDILKYTLEDDIEEVKKLTAKEDENGILRDADGFMVLRETHPGALEEAIEKMKNGSKCG